MSRQPPKRVQHSPLSSSSPAASSPSSSLPKSSAMTDAFFTGLKSLTPQRKHHKLLRDGREVWSEDVEKIFVQGLKDYWESPWATYSRGRSRWRNQFLVDHLKKHGIERSKKQVASHIQVLRNMWRGEPEFHLVAGGEELFQENGLLASPKKAGTPSTPGSELLDEQQPSSSSTPDSSFGDFTAQFPSTIPLPHFTPTEDALSTHSPSLDSYPISSSPSSLLLPYTYAPPSPPAPRNRLRPAVKLEPIHMHPGLFNLPLTPQGPLNDSDLSPLFPPYTHAQPIRVLSLGLWAEGMQLFTVDVEGLNATLPPSSRHPDATSILVRVKLGISSMDDLLSSPNLHGFHAAITFSEGWSSEAKCLTKSCIGPAHVTQEVGYLEVNSTPSAIIAPPHAVTCILPESSLSRCKWLPIEHDNITQQIVIDGVVVAAFVYHIERTVPGSPPSVELVDFQKYKPNSRRRTQSQQVMMSPPLSAHSSTSSVSSPSFQHAAFGSNLIPADFSGTPHSTATLVEQPLHPYMFNPNANSRVYSGPDASAPQVTATSSASAMFPCPR